MTNREASQPRIAEWSWIGLLLILGATVWWRCHTMGPALADHLGNTRLWPVCTGESEPLDCDEAAYAYMGRRLRQGAVLYRDLAENKPPAGYWLYQLAVTVGRPDELTIRLFPIPLVLATVFLLWWCAGRLAGPIAACAAAFVYALLSTDPYLYGNGAQLELAMNLCSAAGLGAMILSLGRPGLFWPFVAGLCVAAGTLIRQVAIVYLPIYMLVLMVGGRTATSPKSPGENELAGGLASGIRRALMVLAGTALLGGVAVFVLYWQGALPAMIENVVVGGAALVADTPAPPNAPSPLIRWLTGNSDPNTGKLPWPFGKTNYLVWWGGGSWPLWAFAALAAAAVARSEFRARGLILLWFAGSWVQVILPQQYWAHYYLLPTPGIAILAGLWIERAWHGLRRAQHGVGRGRRLGAVGALSLALLAIGSTTYLQVRDYLMVPPELLTVRYKGGAQWVRLREIGRELGRKSPALTNPSLLVWGWQSPLYFYSGLDCPSRHFFVNDLVKTQAGTGHKLVSRWIAELLADLDSRRPSLIFTGYPPFPALEERLRNAYRVSRLIPEAPVLWVLNQDARSFASEGRKIRTIFPGGDGSGGPLLRGFPGTQPRDAPATTRVPRGRP